MAQQSGVRRGVARPQPQVGRQRVGRAAELLAVGQVDLVGVACVQLLLHLREGVGVPGRRSGRCAPRRAPARARGTRPWSKNWTAAAAHPDPRRARGPRAAPAGRDARRSRSSPPSARPGPRRRGRSRPRAPRRRPCRRPRRDLPGAGSPRRGAASKLSETSSSSSTPTSERRPDQSREPPPSSQNTLSLRAKPRRTASTTGSLMPSRQEVPDQLGAVARQDRLRMELHALERELAVRGRPSPLRSSSSTAVTEHGGHERRPRASGSAPPRTATGTPGSTPAPDRGRPSATSPWPGRPGPPFRRTT